MNIDQNNPGNATAVRLESKDTAGVTDGVSRRRFLKRGLVAGMTLTGVTGDANPGGLETKVGSSVAKPGPEVLYNGIKLPDIWPPRDMMPDTYDPMPVPYLDCPPEVIPIDAGRQLFVDDFLIEYTDLDRVFHQPTKYEGNPILKPETQVELNQGYCPTAAPFSDGCFYDPRDKRFKMYYMAGWFDGVALAVSENGIDWERPEFDVVPGTNLVLDPGDLRRDGVSVWLDLDAHDPTERFKMYFWGRRGEIGEKLNGGTGFILTSSDGIHWNWRGEIGQTGDNSTLFYNPFRSVWAFTVRRFGRPVPPWADQSPRRRRKRGRARSYWENSDLMAALGGWNDYDPVFWLGADKLDLNRPGYPLGQVPQIYKVDAVGYESLMLGLIQPHYGPANAECAARGIPKLTELQLAFSRDGFHWDRSNRQTFIGATLEQKSWERAYIHSIGGVCNVVGDKLHFYYSAFQGDESNRNENPHWNGMYANASTGLATLRRDGFASLEAEGREGVLLTRRLKFEGEYLFLNADASKGEIAIELCDERGTTLPGYSREECKPVATDGTMLSVRWKNGRSLSAFASQPIRFKIHLRNSRLFAFWVSRDRSGKSGGAMAAGGPGITGTWDA